MGEKESFLRQLVSESVQAPHPCFRRAKVMDLHMPAAGEGEESR